jgi:cytochrome c2
MKHSTTLLFLLLLPIISTFFSCKDHSKENTQNQNLYFTDSTQIEISINLEKILTKEKGIMVDVLYDNYFNSSKKYLGYEFLPILDSVIKSASFDTAGSVVTFECTDGYKPSMPISGLYNSAKPYIVYKDLDQKGALNWPDSIQAKFVPYYLVWDSTKQGEHSLVWPYGLVSITLSSTNSKYKQIYPNNNSSMIKGFELYRDNCMKCHSLNGIGGSMAPEFNFPKNITEYWREDDIIAFAKNSKTYRSNSKMSPINNLSDSDFVQIISYLKYIKEYKVNPTLNNSH